LDIKLVPFYPESLANTGKKAKYVKGSDKEGRVLLWPISRSRTTTTNVLRWRSKTKIV